VGFSWQWVKSNMPWKRNSRLLLAAVSRMTCHHSPQSYPLRDRSPAEPCYASNCAAKMQNFFHSSILQFDLYAEKFFLFEIKTVYLHHKKKTKLFYLYYNIIKDSWLYILFSLYRNKIFY
jgi:hypothetical protein